MSQDYNLAPYVETANTFSVQCSRCGERLSSDDCNRNKPFTHAHLGHSDHVDSLVDFVRVIRALGWSLVTIADGTKGSVLRPKGYSKVLCPECYHEMLRFLKEEALP